MSSPNNTNLATMSELRESLHQLVMIDFQVLDRDKSRDAIVRLQIETEREYGKAENAEKLFDRVEDCVWHPLMRRAINSFNTTCVEMPDDMRQALRKIRERDAHYRKVYGDCR